MAKDNNSNLEEVSVPSNIPVTIERNGTNASVTIQQADKPQNPVTSALLKRAAEAVEPVSLAELAAQAQDGASSDSAALNQTDSDLGIQYDQDGYDSAGFNDQGFDREGYDIGGYKDGFNRSGYDKDGFDQYGHSSTGHGRDGYNPQGYNSAGYDREGYDEEGYNLAGLDKDGRSRDDADTQEINELVIESNSSSSSSSSDDANAQEMEIAPIGDSAPAID